MKSFIRQRPWIIIVAVKVLFVGWWIGFVAWASRHTPEYVEIPKVESHGGH